jgi:hypothetical protein
MGIRELREKYRNVKGCQAVNDAVRNEVVGGERLLNLAEWLYRQKNLSAREKKILQDLIIIKNEMKQSIILKYQLKQIGVTNE